MGSELSSRGYPCAVSAEVAIDLLVKYLGLGSRSYDSAVFVSIDVKGKHEIGLSTLHNLDLDTASLESIESRNIEVDPDSHKCESRRSLSRPFLFGPTSHNIAQDELPLLAEKLVLGDLIPDPLYRTKKGVSILIGRDVRTKLEFLEACSPGVLSGSQFVAIIDLDIICPDQTLAQLVSTYSVGRLHSQGGLRDDCAGNNVAYIMRVMIMFAIEHCSPAEMDAHSLMRASFLKLVATQNRFSLYGKESSRKLFRIPTVDAPSVELAQQSLFKKGIKRKLDEMEDAADAIDYTCTKKMKTYFMGAAVIENAFF